MPRSHTMMDGTHGAWAADAARQYRDTVHHYNLRCDFTFSLNMKASAFILREFMLSEATVSYFTEQRVILYCLTLRYQLMNDIHKNLSIWEDTWIQAEHVPPSLPSSGNASFLHL